MAKGGMVLSTRVAPVTKTIVRALAEERGISAAAWAREAVTEKLRREVAREKENGAPIGAGAK